MTESLLMQEKAEAPGKSSARLPGIESRLAWAGGLQEFAAQRKPLAAQPALVQAGPLGGTVADLVQRQAQPEEEEEIQTKGCPGLIQREAAPEEEEEIQTKSCPGLIQREAAPEEEEEIQTKVCPGLIQREAAPEEEEEIQTKSCSGLIQREAAPEEEEEIQTKLVVGPPDDEYEREADRVAEQVVSMPEPKVQRACPKCEEEETVQTSPLAAQITPLVQRQMGSEEEEKIQSKPLAGQIADPLQLGSKTEEDKSSLMRIKCDECPKKRLLHRLGIADQSNDSPIVHEVLRSPGQPLDPSLRESMERRFGNGLRTRIQPAFATADFGNVRIHSDNKAAESAQAVNALAYTMGRNIVFGEGQYAPATITGRRLIAHELTHVVQQMSSGSPRRYRNISSDSGTSGDFVQRNGAQKPTSENVWGFLVTRRMCGCISDVRDGIAWANTAGATYAACDNPANPTGSDVERCFERAHPGSSPIAVTSSSGIMTLPPPSADPCEKIENKATFVHETMHSRHTDSIARSLGPAFFAEWRRLAGDPDRLEKLRGRFPAQVTAFETRWNEGHDLAQDEVNSYRWERRFLEDTLAALNRIC